MPDDSGNYGGGDPSTGYNPGAAFGMGMGGDTLANGDQSGGGWWNSLLGWLQGGDQTNGGGGGGGGGFPVGSAAKGFAGTTGLDWAKFLANLYASQKKGKFQNVPLSPEQQALFGFTFNRLVNSPDNSKNLYPLALSRAYQTPSFDINAAMSGKPAYSAGQQIDYPTLMKMIASWNPEATSTTTPNATGGGGGGPAFGPDERHGRGGHQGGLAK